jgi:hypothetical protein
VVIDQVVREHSTLTRWDIEKGKLVLSVEVLSLLCLRVVEVEHGSCKTGAHFSTVVAVHPQATALAQRGIAATELTEGASREDGVIGGLEVLVNNETTVVDKAIIVN